MGHTYVEAVVDLVPGEWVEGFKVGEVGADEFHSSLLVDFLRLRIPFHDPSSE